MNQITKQIHVTEHQNKRKITSNTQLKTTLITLALLLPRSNENRSVC